MKKILIPCDFSDTSESALNYAIELSKYFSADLVLLHIDMVPVLSPEMSLTAYSLEDMKQDSLDALKNLADKIMLTHNLAAKIDYCSEMGTTAEVVSEKVKKLGIDLVVMGISGHGSGFMKNMVGSASVDVSKNIEVPLVIVPPDASFKKIQHIAYACQYDEHLETSSVLIKVKYFATAFGARMSVVHVLPQDHHLSPKETGISNFVERSLGTADHKTYMIHENTAAVGLLNFVNQNNVDLVIVEPRKHSFFHKVFSSSTINQVAFESPVPVLTIHEEIKK